MDVLRVDENPAGRRIVETEQETEYGGFSAPGRTYDGYLFSCRDGEAEVAEDGARRVVSKRDIFETDRSSVV